MTDAFRIGAPSADPVALPAIARGRAEREALARRARATDAGRQLARCFPRWATALDQLRWRALVRAGRTTSRSTPTTPTRGTAATPTPRRSCAATASPACAPTRLDLSGRSRPLIDGQAAADRDAGLDWTRVTAPASALDDRAARARTRAADRPRRPRRAGPARATSGARSRRRLGLDRRAGATTSRAGRSRTPTPSTPTTCAAGGSPRPRWLRARRRAARRRSSASSGRSACSSCPRATGDGWQLDARALAGRDPAARRARRPARARPARAPRCPPTPSTQLLERINPHTLHAGPRECLDSAGQLAAGAHARARAARARPGVPRDKRDRWGRLLVRRAQLHRPRRQRAQPSSRCASSRSPARDFPQRRLGSAPLDGALRAAERGDGSRRGRADRGRARPAAAALHRGRRRTSRTPSASGA